MRRILCIEPSSSLRGLLTQLLREGGWEVCCCGDLSDLPADLDSVDAVITAATLPSGSYEGVLQRFRGEGVPRSLPILLLTADAELAGGALALAKGVTEVFCKSDLGALRPYLAALAGRDDRRFDGCRALILDDDVVIGLYLEQVLSELGLSVERKTSSQEALSAVAAGRFDLLLVDIVLGMGQSGNHFIRLFRQSGQHPRSTAVIAISGYDDDVRRLDALRAGADAYLSKPIDRDELQLAVSRLLLEGADGESSAEAAEPQFGRQFELSRREAAICSMAIAGQPDKAIAESLGISFWTVRTHLASVFRKCGVSSRIELARLLSGQSPRPGVSMRSNHVSALPAELPHYLVENLHVGVLVTDGAHRIVYANPAFANLSGYPVGEVIGRQPALWRSGEHQPEFYRAMLGQLESAGRWSGNVRNLRKDGKVFEVWLEISSLPPGGPQDARYLALYRPHPASVG